MNEDTPELIAEVQKSVDAQADTMIVSTVGIVVLFLVLVVFAGYVVKHLRDENKYLKREINAVRERERNERAHIFQELVESVHVLKVVVGALDKMLEWFKGANDES